MMGILTALGLKLDLETATIAALEKGDVQKLKQIALKDANMVLIISRQHKSISKAAKKGNEELMDYLIELEDTHAIQKLDFKDVLKDAIHNEISISCLKKLLNRLTQEQLNACYHVCAAKTTVELLKVIEEYYQPTQQNVDYALGWAGRCLGLDKMHYFKNSGGDVNVASSSGRSALGHVVTNHITDDNRECFDQLLEWGADINFVEWTGLSVLAIAAHSESKVAVEELLILGARDLDGKAKQNALDQLHDEVFKILVAVDNGKLPLSPKNDFWQMMHEKRMEKSLDNSNADMRFV